ncbi:MAG: mucin desulfatase, partial [Lachnospiraceae bacterium]|nr:mucin desulfatase [Lachnospiraceae bacterium]
MPMSPALETIDEAIAAFTLEGVLREKAPYGNGHINDTFLLACDTAKGEKKYILQRMNHSIFQDPVSLMENVANVTAYLQKNILAKGGDPARETLSVIKTRSGANY